MNIVITGGNKGLGFNLIKTFAENGHNVMAGIYKGESSAAVEGYADLSGGKVTTVSLNLADEESVRNAADISFNRYGKIDVVINCGGILLPDDTVLELQELNTDILRKSIEINAIGSFLVAKYFLPVMRNDGKGMLMLVTSEAGSVTHNGSNYPAYSVSKAAANKIAFVLRTTLKDKYIIYAVHPGRMNTEMGHKHAQIEPETSAKGIYDIALGKKSIPEEYEFINYLGEPMDK